MNGNTDDYDAFTSLAASPISHLPIDSPYLTVIRYFIPVQVLAAPPMPREIEISSDTVTFDCGNSGRPTYYDLHITNRGTRRAVYKMNCTSTTIFRANPANGFIGGGGSVLVRLWFRNRQFCHSTIHYFAVYIIFNDEAEMPLDVFTDRTYRADGVKKLYVTFTRDAIPDLPENFPPSLANEPSHSTQN